MNNIRRTNVNDTICPEEIRVRNRRKKLAGVRRSNEYKDRQRRNLVGKVCIWCKRDDRLLIHHTDLSDYDTPEIYIATLDKGWPMCVRCHNALHSGRILCPVCKQRTTKYATCYQCMPAERKEEIERKKVMKRKLRKLLHHESYLKWKEKVNNEG